ncbi:MAG: DinB family protein [bacterium]|nr:DinB family protein [bacterium]
MNWTATLKRQIDDVYQAAEGLLDLVDPDALDWKPETGSNWMSMGQLLEHMATACGKPCRGFLTGDWEMPEGVPEDADPSVVLPPVEAMPGAGSVETARTALAADKELALATIDEAGEQALAEKIVTAPWRRTPLALGYQLLTMVDHLAQHRDQLFYYLKLQGKEVHTFHLWKL